ncbi:hypothetical protein [Kordiimonas pumila]|uniref:Heme exporter protein D n=1 Tax=Kordiimonas pumila TaxID=2161677 RepID=A0ABV7D3S8_9PROT|nr:hypothetical protein [Kordiimonas pumila]
MASDYSLFIGISYGLSALGLVWLGAKSFMDMKKTDLEAQTLKRARRSKGES